MPPPPAIHDDGPSSAIPSRTEKYRLDYSYDPTSSRGPLHWNDVDESDSEWEEYEDDHDLHDLGLDGNECDADDNIRPSPLHLKTNAECIDRHEMLTRQIDELTCTIYDVEFEITPHTLKMHLPESDDTCIRPTVNLSGNLPEEFVLVWLEVHMRSEHVIDGVRYDAEIEMVHLGQGSDDDQIATVSVLVDATGRMDNPEFQWMLDRWQEVHDEYGAACAADGRRGARRRMRAKGGPKRRQRQGNIESIRNDLTDAEFNKLYYGTANPPRDESGNVVQLIPDGSVGDDGEQQPSNQRRAQYGDDSCRPDRRGHGCPGFGKRRKPFPYSLWPTIWYYGYRGSIPYPPCSKIVNWRVLDVPMKISRRQYKQMGRLLSSYRDDDCEADAETSPTGENYRPLQGRGKADIFHCTPRDFRPWMYLPEDQ